ncbi:1499_t:CDS:1, partial [Acaulospora morrowiae]
MTCVEEFFAQNQLSLLDSTDDDLSSTLDVELSTDDWQWEEMLRLTNAFSNWT